jgi:hypothetical protein
MWSGGEVIPGDADDLLLYPNPCSGQLTVSPVPGGEECTVAVYGIDGRLVHALALQPGESTAVDLTGVEAGLYIARVVSGESVRTGLFTVVRR